MTPSALEWSGRPLSARLPGVWHMPELRCEWPDTAWQVPAVIDRLREMPVGRRRLMLVSTYEGFMQEVGA